MLNKKELRVPYHNHGLLSEKCVSCLGDLQLGFVYLGVAEKRISNEFSNHVLQCGHRIIQQNGKNADIPAFR